MHRHLLVLLVLLVACAPAEPIPSSPGSRRPSRIIESPGAIEVHIADDSREVGAHIAATPEQVWPRLLEAYTELGIVPTTTDCRTWTLGNPQHSVYRRLGGVSLDKYFECGQNLGGSIATTHRLQLSLQTKLRPAGSEATQIETRITAAAFSNEGASSHPIRCTSRGTLEERIAAMVRERLS